MFAYAILPLTALLAASPPAQEGSWLAWHGCWRATGVEAPDRVVCIVPSGNAGEAQLNVIVDGDVAERVTLRATGVASPVEEGGCRGTEVGRWSQDARRVYLRAELDCEGVKRVSASVLALVTADEWVDVQTVSVGEQHATRTVRYRAMYAPTNVPAEIRAALEDGRHLAREAARLQAADLLDVEDVVEATSQLPAPGVQALVAARRSGFDLDARKLVQLERAGVPSSVIDVMIAVSYPKTFAIANDNEVSAREPEAGRGSAGRAGIGYGYSCYDPYWDRYAYNGRYSSCYDSYRYGWGSRYGYGYRPGYYGWNDSPRVIVIVRPDDGEDSGPRSGSVVKGRGFVQGGSSTGGSAAPRGERTSTPTRSSEPASATGSSTTGSSSGTTSSGTTGRTAIPRGSGGGGGGGGGN
jgi:hypothetical protein